MQVVFLQILALSERAGKQVRAQPLSAEPKAARSAEPAGRRAGLRPMARGKDPGMAY